MYAKPELQLVGRAAAVVLGLDTTSQRDGSSNFNSPAGLVLGLDE